MDQQQLNVIFEALGKSIIEAPNLAIMVVDEKLTIVWHNEAHARLLGTPLEQNVGRKCFETTAETKAHKGCPTQVTLKEGKTTQSLWNFGEKNGFIVTLPLPNGLVAKFMTMVPKEADGAIERF